MLSWSKVTKKSKLHEIAYPESNITMYVFGQGQNKMFTKKCANKCTRSTKHESSYSK